MNSTDNTPRTTHYSRRTGGSGAAILGLLIVVLIIGLLYTMAGPSGNSALDNAVETRDNAKAMRTRIEMDQLTTMAVQHKLTTGEYPTTPEDLGVAGLPGYTDEFGTTVRFFIRSEGPANTIEVWSAGEDLEHGTEDDTMTGSARLPL